MNAQEDTAQAQYLSFFIAKEEYAIGILRVREIIEFGTLTVVPATHPSIRGVINLRGAVVPVIDLAVKLGLAPAVITRWTCIVIVEVVLDGEATVMGVMADSVSQVVELSPQDIESAPAFGTRLNVDYLLGMGKLGAKFLLLLDIDRVLSAEALGRMGSADPFPAEPAALQSEGSP